MAKLLYAMKIDLLSTKIETEFPKGTVFSGCNQKDNIHRFVMFVVYVYVPWWLKAPFLTSDPANDLSLIKSLYHFKDIDSVAVTRLSVSDSLSNEREGVENFDFKLWTVSFHLSLL